MPGAGIVPAGDGEKVIIVRTPHRNPCGAMQSYFAPFVGITVGQFNPVKGLVAEQHQGATNVLAMPFGLGSPEGRYMAEYCFGYGQVMNAEIPQ